MSATTSSRTGILVILDGFGVNPDAHFNAIAQARTPTLDKLEATCPHVLLDASESQVGLPKGFMGNSEVGHLNIGAGRIVFQDFSLISRAIEDQSFFSNQAFKDLFEELGKQKGKRALHLIGLLSDGGVHSHISHLFALLQLAKAKGILRVIVHVITDGRDTSPTSGIAYVEKLVGYCAELGVGEIGSVSGRFYSMDRDNRWERTEAAYHAIVAGRAEQTFSDPRAYVRASYDEGVTDEFIRPAVMKGYRGVADGDGVIVFNFRADRARQLTRALTQNEFPFFRRENFPTLCGFVCMTPYDATFKLPAAFGKPVITSTLGEVVSRKGWRQLRIAETEKYAHVTYFFNGGDEKVFEGEKRVLVPSPREVPTYDLKPEMSAREVTERLLEELDSGSFKLAVVNFANCDMVGHTGNLPAAIKAVETIDECLGRIVDWVRSNNAFALITADHGNCEMMQAADGMPLTAHTLLPVPLILLDPQRSKLTMTQNGKLSDVAPSLLALWGLPKPDEMTGKCLVSGL